MKPNTSNTKNMVMADFRNEKVTAPLKLRPAGKPEILTTNFRNEKVTAPLKLKYPIHLKEWSAIFP